MSSREGRRLRVGDEKGYVLEKRCLLRKGRGRMLSKAKGSAPLRKVMGDASAQGRWAHGAGAAKGKLFNTSECFRAPWGT